LQQVSAVIVELDGILAQYGSEANDSRHRLRVAVLAAANKIWSKDGVQFDKLTPVANHPEAAAFYEKHSETLAHHGHTALHSKKGT
jgi:hypothetical protein